MQYRQDDQYQGYQGDVLLERIDRIPSDARRVTPADGRIILAHGEATGHAHTMDTIADSVELYEVDGTMYVRVTGTAARLSHQEHAPLTVAPGDYEVVRQREYSPSEIRRVAD